MSWWFCGEDSGAVCCRHGVARTDFHILRDPSLSFNEVLKTSARHLRSTPQHSQQYPSSPQSAAPHSDLHMSPGSTLTLLFDKAHT